MQEIERKFIIKNLKNIDELDFVYSERYFLFNEDGIEIRITQKENKYIFERKEKISDLTRNWLKFEISEREFNELKKISSQRIIRKNYYIDKNTSIKVYEWDFIWLIRLEKEFENEIDAQKFDPSEYSKFGDIWNEITVSQLGKDSQLVKLTKKIFIELLS